MSIQQIVVATDFSDEALHAAQFASNLAVTHGARLALLHVHHPAPNPYRSQQEDVQTERNLHAALKELGERVGRPGLEIKTAVESGPTADTIARFVRQHGYDLVVVPLSPPGAHRDKVHQNLVRELVEDARVPILAVPAPG